MNRRAFVSRVVGGVVAATVAPFVPLPKQILGSYGLAPMVNGFAVFPATAAQQFKVGDLITIAGGHPYRITGDVQSGHARHLFVTPVLADARNRAGVRVPRRFSTDRA